MEHSKIEVSTTEHRTSLALRLTSKLCVSFNFKHENKGKMLPGERGKSETQRKTTILEAMDKG